MGLVLIVIFGLILTYSTDQWACEGQPVNDNLPITSSQQIFGERLIGQSFLSTSDNLNRIDLFLQTYSRQNTEDVTVRLLEIPVGTEHPLDGIEVFQTSFNASIVWDKDWHSFDLPKPLNSANKTYLITLQSPESKDGNAITIGGIQQNVYVSGNAYIYAPDLVFSQLTPVPADMMFRACYELNTIERLYVLLQQMTTDRPALWGVNSFYLISITVYFVFIAGLLWRLGKLYR